MNGGNESIDAATPSSTSTLWIAPSMNHYKARALDSLAMEPGIELTVLCGGDCSTMRPQTLRNGTIRF